MRGKRFISSILSMAMVFTLNAGMSFAEETPAPVTEEPVVEEQTTDVPEETPAVEEESVSEEVPVIEEQPIEQEPEVEQQEEKQDENEYPAQTFTGTTPDGKISVEVRAGEGALPKDVSMRVENVNTDAIKGLVESVIDGQADTMSAVNVIFTDVDGHEVEPLAEIIVNIKMAGVEAADTYQLVHIDQANNPEKIADEKIVSISNTEATFVSDVFSVYVVVGDGSTEGDARLTVNFYNGDNIIETMYVKTNDTTEEIERILYDPGAGTPPQNQIFVGWSVSTKNTEDGKNYTAETTPSTIQEIRALVRTLVDDPTFKEGDVLNIYAMFLKGYKITYIGDNGAVIGGTNIPVDGNTTSVQYTVNQAYTPQEDHKFEGWLVSEGSTNITKAEYDGKVVENPPYKNGTVLTITGSVTLSVDAPEGYWLVFHENKGTYVAPQFIKKGESTVEPSVTMQRPGYTFGGWYTDEACTDGNEFTFGSPLSDRTHIYAKWIENTRANYTVIVWRQNVDGTGYDFAESITEEGTVGATIDPRSGTSKTYTGFTLDDYDTDVKIAPEGGSVANVYFNRNQITLTFQTYQNRRWTTVQTMTGRYGQNLSKAGYTWPTNYDWYYNNDNTRMTFMDAFLPPSGNSMTFHGYNPSGSNYIRFYKQNANDTEYPDLNSPTNEVTSSGGTFSITDKYNGFKAASYSTNGTTWTTLGSKDPSTGVYTSVSNYNSLYIRFERLKYNISFMDGRYVDGNGNPVEGAVSQGQLKKVTDVTYESDISSYNVDGDNYYDPSTDHAVAGYIFEGWYIDDACTQPFTFTNMPEGLTVYAKWRQIQYRVFLHPNADTDSTLDWGSESQAMNFRVSYGGQVSTPTGLRSEYEFVGWFLDEDFNTPFNGDAYVLNETTVTSAYDKTKDFTDPMDKWGNGATTNADVLRPWITKKLDLYARWRAKLVGADGIGVIYDANGGTNAPSDTNKYKDSAECIAGAASTPADSSKQHFEYWVVQKWDAEKGDYVDTDKVVYPGNNFQVLKANAHDVDNGDGTHTYTVQLRAEYIDNGVLTPTHINWYGNGGLTSDGKDVIKNEGLKINQAIDIEKADTFKRDGYRFVGWERVEEKGSPSGTTDNLFLKYDYQQKKFFAKDSSGNFTVDATQVAADEELPYHDLYAVWESVIYVWHSSTAQKEEIPMSDLEKAGYKLDIISKVNTADYYYGGWYTKYNGDETKPYNAFAGDRAGEWKYAEASAVDGSAITIDPATDAGKTYYLKEVPKAYLSNYSEMIYKLDGEKIVNLFQMSAVDDLNYSETGFVVINAENKATVVRTFTFKQHSGKTTMRRADLIFSGVSNPSYLTYLDMGKLGLVTENSSFTVTPYWKTKDGKTITGKTRSIELNDLTITNFKKQD